MRLTYAGFTTYLDRMRALEVGDVAPEGVELEMTLLRWDEHDPFQRVAEGAFDVAEMSMSLYMTRYGDGDRNLVAIPVFPSRSFRHNTLFVNTERGIRVPGDLRGKRLGLADFWTTGALWVRAMLEHDYGVSPTEIEWCTGGYYAPVEGGPAPRTAPRGVTISRAPPGSWLRQMFLDGELDALLTFDPAIYKPLAPRIERLFVDHRHVERDYYQRTGLFPIMHTVVIRRAVYAAAPWVAVSLLEAFIASKRRGWVRLRHTGALAVALPWLEDALAEIDDLFAGDPFRYGFAANRAELDAMTGYAYEQGLTPRRLDPAELFAPQTLGHPGDAMP